MIGAHASISPKIINGLKYMKSIGATAVQIFTGSNQSASLASKQQLTLEDKNPRKNNIVIPKPIVTIMTELRLR